MSKATEEEGDMSLEERVTKLEKQIGEWKLRSEPRKTIKKDEVVMISGGEYSDYFIEGLLVALCDFDHNDAVAQLMKTWQHDYRPYASDVRRYLLDKGYAKAVNYTEWHFDYDVNNLR